MQTVILPNAVENSSDWIKVNKPYQQICREHFSFTGFHFGDDLPQKIKDINMTNRVGQKLSGDINIKAGIATIICSMQGQSRCGQKMTTDHTTECTLLARFIKSKVNIPRRGRTT